MEIGDDSATRAKKSAKIGATHHVSLPPGPHGLTLENLEGLKHTYVVVKDIAADSPLVDVVGKGWLIMKIDGVYAPNKTVSSPCVTARANLMDR